MKRDLENQLIDGLDHTDDSVHAGTNRLDFHKKSFFAASAAGAISSLVLASSFAYAAGTDAPKKLLGQVHTRKR